MARGRGGRRQGAPGVQYPNRTDMQAGPRAIPAPPRAPTQLPQTAPGQPYGVAAQQQQALHAVPMPTPMHAPTERPSEHVMAGAPVGPGAGPDTLTTPSGQQPPAALAQVDPAALLRMMVASHPDIPELRIMADQAN